MQLKKQALPALAAQRTGNRREGKSEGKRERPRRGGGGRGVNLRAGFRTEKRTKGGREGPGRDSNIWFEPEERESDSMTFPLKTQRRIVGKVWLQQMVQLRVWLWSPQSTPGTLAHSPHHQTLLQSMGAFCTRVPYRTVQLKLLYQRFQLVNAGEHN